MVRPLEQLELLEQFVSILDSYFTNLVLNLKLFQLEDSIKEFTL